MVVTAVQQEKWDVDLTATAKPVVAVAPLPLPPNPPPLKYLSIKDDLAVVLSKTAVESTIVCTTASKEFAR
jgi:hypothetical protein